MVPKTSNRRILSTLDILATGKSRGLIALVLSLGWVTVGEADSDVSGSD